MEVFWGKNDFLQMKDLELIFGFIHKHKLISGEKIKELIDELEKFNHRGEL
jgi:hypothetical protein